LALAAADFWFHLRFFLQKETLDELNKDPSYGIYKGEEVFKEIFERQYSIMNKYLLSWRSYT